MPINEKYQIEKFILSDGSCPFDEWFQNLEQVDQIIIDQRLIRVMSGSFGEIRSLQRGLWELKFRVGGGLRVYYGISGKTVVLLLIGGNKRTQKRDIRYARELWAFFKRED